MWVDAAAGALAVMRSQAFGNVLEQEDGARVVVVVVVYSRADDPTRPCVRALGVVPEAGAPAPHSGTYEGDRMAVMTCPALWRRGALQ
ncbi:MAG: hypothetical protein K8H88_10505 [Sandaracinaceae bacterium]|nr:hypothetical protein [Sandaracinaceae bacterium]